MLTGVICPFGTKLWRGLAGSYPGTISQVSTEYVKYSQDSTGETPTKPNSLLARARLGKGS